MIPTDERFFEMRKTLAMVLDLAQEIARNSSVLRWTPLIPTAVLDSTIEMRRIEVINLMKDKAQQLAVTLLQRRGTNIVGQVIRHENVGTKLDSIQSKRVRENDKIKGDEIPATKAKLQHVTSPKAVLETSAKSSMFKKLSKEKLNTASSALKEIVDEPQMCAPVLMDTFIASDVIIPADIAVAKTSPTTSSSMMQCVSSMKDSEPVHSHAYNTKSKSETVLCCCGCGLETAADSGYCQGCCSAENGVMRPECNSNYRRCKLCKPVQVKSAQKLIGSFVFDNNEAEVRNPLHEQWFRERMQEPCSSDKHNFNKLVNATIPTPLVGKNRSQCVLLMGSYGTEEEKRFHGYCCSQTLLEFTLPDAEEYVTNHVQLHHLRALRFLFTGNQDTLSWWLNDVIVNDYMQLINLKAMENGIKAHCFNSVFTSTFENQGYRGVKKWSEQFCKNHKVKSLFGMERLIFLINVNNNHWAFMAFFFA